MLVVQDRASVVRDTRTNSPWLLLAFALIVVWLLVSAGVSVLGRLPYATPGYLPAAGDAITFLRTVPGQELDYPTALYSTAINMTTVGFGDIYPLSGAGRLLAVLNAFAGLTSFALLTAILVMALQPSSDGDIRRSDSTDSKAAFEVALKEVGEQLDVRRDRASKLLVESKELLERMPKVDGDTEGTTSTKELLLTKVDAVQDAIRDMGIDITFASLDSSIGKVKAPSGPRLKL